MWELDAGEATLWTETDCGSTLETEQGAQAVQRTEVRDLTASND